MPRNTFKMGLWVHWALVRSSHLLMSVHSLKKMSLCSVLNACSGIFLLMHSFPAVFHSPVFKESVQDQSLLRSSKLSREAAGSLWRHESLRKDTNYDCPGKKNGRFGLISCAVHSCPAIPLGEALSSMMSSDCFLDARLCGHRRKSYWTISLRS